MKFGAAPCLPTTWRYCTQGTQVLDPNTAALPAEVFGDNAEWL
jgi:hypothetical protein